MRISAKGRYAIAATIYLAKRYANDEYITVISISEELDISKIYLEQVFSLLKQGEIVTSVKGSQGGYKLTRHPNQITVCDILSPIEAALFETTKESVRKHAAHIEQAAQNLIYLPLDQTIQGFFKQITLENLLLEADKFNGENGYMFYI
jgi:Rrf2 family protein